MQNKRFFISGLFLLVMSLVLVMGSTMVKTTDVVVSDTDDKAAIIEYHSVVCTYVNGEQNGECTSNVVYNSALTIIAAALGNEGAIGSYNYTSLCNMSGDGSGVGCSEPVAAQTESFNEFSAGGLSPVEGTYFNNSASVGNFTISTTFTATDNSLTVNATRLQNQTGGLLGSLAGNNFTSVTLQTNDQLTINWTVWVS